MDVSQLSAAGGAAQPDSYLWNPETQPVHVALSFDVIDRMTPEITEAFRALKRRGAEIGGLLLGRVSPGEVPLVRVNDYVSIPCERRFGPSYHLSPTDLEGFDREIAKWRNRAGGMTVVGYYRSHTRESLKLSAEDQALLESRFPEPFAVALLVKPFSDKPFEASFTSRRDGRFTDAPAEPVFVYRRRDLGGGAGELFTPAPVAGREPPEPSSARNRMLAASLDTPSEAPAPRPHVPMSPPVPAAVPATVAGEPQAPKPLIPAPPDTVHTIPPIVRPPAPPTVIRRGVSGWVAALLSLTFALAGGFFGYKYAFARPGSGLNPTTSHHLGLQARVQTDAIIVSWDLAAPPFADAIRGIFIIEDGDNVKTIDVDAATLARGSISYRPVNRQVLFRMDVMTSERAGVTESLPVERPQ